MHTASKSSPLPKLSPLMFSQGIFIISDAPNIWLRSYYSGSKAATVLLSNNCLLQNVKNPFYLYKDQAFVIIVNKKSRCLFFQRDSGLSTLVTSSCFLELYFNSQISTELELKQRQIAKKMSSINVFLVFEF